MATNPSDVLKLGRDNEAKFFDVRFSDLPGLMQHFTVPFEEIGEEVFDEGFGFDGSSIRGFQEIQESDMILVPDPTTAVMDPFTRYPTLITHAYVKDPLTGEFYSRDPRYVAKKAEDYLTGSGIADTAYFGPEAEFYLFDSIRFDQNQHEGYYHIDAVEGVWNSGAEEGGNNLGYKPRYKEGYFPVPPMDHYQDVRSEMVLILRALGIPVEVHHHEVGTAGQSEIDMGFAPLLAMADRLMLYKYVVKNVARRNRKTATFMPKPIFQDNGSGAASPLRTNDQLVQEACAGIRGAGESSVLAAKPFGGRAHTDLFQVAQVEENRVSLPGRGVQSLPRVFRVAHGRYRRDQEQDRAARAGGQRPLRATARRDPRGSASARVARRVSRCPRG